MSAVIQAAIAARNNPKANDPESSWANPFKRRRRTLDEDPITEATPLSRSEIPDRRPAEGLSIETHRYGSIGEPIVQRQASGEWQNTSLSPSRDAPLEGFRGTSGADRDYSGGRGHSPMEGENDGHDDLEGSDISEDVYGLTATSYRRVVRLFSLVPITALLTIAIFILLLHTLWPPQKSSSFALYLGLFGFAAATWIVSFALRIPIYLACTILCRPTPPLTPCISTLLQVLVEEALRLCSLILVHIRLEGGLSPSDSAFSRIWALAIGWAVAEIAVSVYQGYEQIFLYKDVVSSDESTVTSHRPPNQWTSEVDSARFASADIQARYAFDDPEEFMNEEIDQLVRIRARFELEELYGIPVPNIPVFISCLLRIDSIILSLALYLLISSSYVSNLSAFPTSDPHNVSQAIRDTVPAFIIIVAFHTLVSLIWTATLLPRIGIHSASYIGLLLALGGLFAGLGRWDAV